MVHSLLLSLRCEKLASFLSSLRTDKDLIVSALDTVTLFSSRFADSPLPVPPPLTHSLTFLASFTFLNSNKLSFIKLSAVPFNRHLFSLMDSFLCVWTHIRPVCGSRSRATNSPLPFFHSHRRRFSLFSFPVPVFSCVRFSLAPHGFTGSLA